MEVEQRELGGFLKWERGKVMTVEVGQRKQAGSEV